MERLRAELVRNQNGQGNFRPLGRKNDPYIISDSDSDHEDSKSSKKPSSHNPGGTIYASLAPASSYYRPPAPGAIQMPVPHPAPAPRIPAPTLSSTSKLSAFTPSPASSSTAAAYSSRSSNIFSGDSEELQMPQIGPSDYDPNEYKSSEEAQKELLDLVHGAMGADLDVDPEMAFVEGFAKGIKLLPHQIQGRTWMTERESGKKWGGILGDMGLGKTYQTICRIVDGANDKDPAKEKERKEYGRTTLVVCPTSVVIQWESEIVKVAPGLRVLAHHGPKRTKDSKTLLRYDVVITSYPTILAEHNNYVPSKNEGEKTSESGDDSEEFVSAAKKVMAKKKKPVAKKHCALFENKFLRIVLDEAHTIKNRSSKTTKACFALKSRYRWCLTGTPIQNSVDELWPLVHFLQVRPLDNWDTFNHQIVKPMKSGKTSVPMKRLHVVLQAIMLRRTKDQEINGQAILKLPDRHLDIITCEFDDSEQEFYDLLVAKADQQLDKIDRQAQSGIQTYSSMLLLLLRLRQACCHPALCTRNAKDDTEAIDPKAQKKGEEEDKEADEMADLFGKMTVAASFCEICRDKLEPDSKSQYCADCELQIVAKARRKSLPNNPSTKGLNELPSSAKIRKMIRILNKINKESDGAEKTIVFSQFTGFLDIIEPFLQKEGFRYIRYDGTMKTPERDAALNKFRNDERTTIALISFKAGSVGLNLTAANHVILMDMWWNPALEDQAFDRAHRLGQKRNVFIYKLMIEETVEKRIQELQEKKRELAKAALTGDKVKKMRLGMDELRMLFSHAARDDDDDAY